MDDKTRLGIGVAAGLLAGGTAAATATWGLLPFAAAGLLWGVWPKLQRRRAAPAEGPRLSLTPGIRELLLAAPRGTSVRQRFAVVAVKNPGPGEIAQLGAVAHLAGEEVHGWGAWTGEPARSFDAAAGQTLAAGAERLFAVAVAAGDGWYGVQPRQDPAFYADADQVAAAKGSGRLPDAAEIRIRFRGQGVNQGVSFRLGLAATGRRAAAVPAGAEPAA